MYIGPCVHIEDYLSTKLQMCYITGYINKHANSYSLHDSYTFYLQFDNCCIVNFDGKDT